MRRSNTRGLATRPDPGLLGRRLPGSKLPRKIIPVVDVERVIPSVSPDGVCISVRPFVQMANRRKNKLVHNDFVVMLATVGGERLGEVNHMWPDKFMKEGFVYSSTF